MNDRRVPAALPSIWTIALVCLAGLFTIAAVRFAAAQSVWTDEATQLSGLTLGFADQLRWLVGRFPEAFAVPIDRSPPLSYWLGSAWTHAFGADVLTTRYLSVCLSVVSILVLWAVARQYLGARTALICAALLALSPNFMVEAVEVRAYAAFILFSTLLICCYMRLLAVRPDPSRLDLWAFALAATLCSYTHFFGIVISAGAFLCLVGSYASVNRRTLGLPLVRKAIWPLLFYSCSMIGLIPFILSASQNSPGADVGTAGIALRLNDIIHDFIKLIYRLFGHQSMLGIPGLSAAALFAGLTLLVSSTIPGANLRARQLLLFLLANLTLVTLVGLTTHAFNAFAATYNVWALPLVALIAATGLTHGIRPIRNAAILSVGVLLAADTYAAIRLSTAGEIYGHTRSTVLKTAVDSAGADNVIVVYVNDAPALYFALMYDYRGRLRQLIDRGSALESIAPPGRRASFTLCELHAGTLLVVHDQELSAEALQFLIARPDLHTEAYRALGDFLESYHDEIAPKWTLVSRNDYLAQSALAMAVFKSRTTEVSSGYASCKPR